MENNDSLDKFGDFLNNSKIIDVDCQIVESPKKYSPVDSDSEAPDNKISKAIDRLMDSLGVEISNYSPEDVLKDLDKINTDDLAFDLASSKIVSDLVSRTALKGVVVQAQMTNRLFDFLADQYGAKGSPMDADALLLIDKATSYLDKLFAIQDRYKKTGIVESLKHISEQRKKDEDSEEEKITLSTHDIQLLIKQAQMKENPAKEGNDG